MRLYGAIREWRVKTKTIFQDVTILLCYGRTRRSVFNPDSVRLPYSESSKQRAGYKKTSLGGGAPASGICELNIKGRFPEDWWDIPIIRPNAKERLGYATQKPLALLDRIIKASSNEGDVVFDPFCGCATTLEAAHHLGRRWIGIDIAIHAIKRVAAVRLRDKLGLVEDRDYIIEGVTAYRGGRERHLWERDLQSMAIEVSEGTMWCVR